MNSNENAFWSEAKKSFTTDFETLDLKTFKAWPSVRSIPLYSDNQFEGQYGADIVRMLPQFSYDERMIWKNVLREPFLGHTIESYAKVEMGMSTDVGVAVTSPWALKSSHHVMSYLVHQKSVKLSDFEQIVEFGPGIGETCRIISDLEIDPFRGTYYLYDLPEVLKVSSYYNGHVPEGITHYSQVPNNKKTLFIGTWSISEAPPSYRDEIFSYFKDASYLLIYQKQAFEYDNEAYFSQRFPQIINKDISQLTYVPIPWLNQIADGNNYLFA